MRKNFKVMKICFERQLDFGLQWSIYGKKLPDAKLKMQGMHLFVVCFLAQQKAKISTCPSSNLCVCRAS
jgi:hypothetical protein